MIKEEEKSHDFQTLTSAFSQESFSLNNFCRKINEVYVPYCDKKIYLRNSRSILQIYHLLNICIVLENETDNCADYSSNPALNHDFKRKMLPHPPLPFWCLTYSMGCSTLYLIITAQPIPFKWAVVIVGTDIQSYWLS